jgi:hypothetical protein
MIILCAINSIYASLPYFSDSNSIYSPSQRMPSLPNNNFGYGYLPPQTIPPNSGSSSKHLTNSGSNEFSSETVPHLSNSGSNEFSSETVPHLSESGSNEFSSENMRRLSDTGSYELSEETIQYLASINSENQN